MTIASEVLLVLGCLPGCCGWLAALLAARAVYGVPAAVPFASAL
jgi:hypothetical protein